MPIVAALFAGIAAPSRAETIHVAAPPSSLALSRDGLTLFVGLDRLKGHGGGIVAFARDGNQLRELGRIDVPGGTTSLAVTPDGKTVVFATRIGLGVVAASALLDSSPRTVAVVRDSDAPRTNQVVLSPDGKYAFATNAQSATLGVAQLGVAPSGEPTIAFIGHVPLDLVPGGLALAPDGATLYVASEVATDDASIAPGANDPHLGRMTCAVNYGWNGILSAVDVRTAIEDPAHAVLARIAAGCAPARVAISPDGRTAWVSVRGENRVVGIDLARMRSDPSHAAIADVAVGNSPIGLACSADGAWLLVADSNRPSDADNPASSTLSLIDTRAARSGNAAALVATIPTGSLAREIVRASDGTFFITDYNAKTIDVLILPLHGSTEHS